MELLIYFEGIKTSAASRSFVRVDARCRAWGGLWSPDDKTSTCVGGLGCWWYGQLMKRSIVLLPTARPSTGLLDTGLRGSAFPSAVGDSALWTTAIAL